MSRFDEPQFEALLERLLIHLRQENYGKCARFGYPYAARLFLRYLERRGQRLEEVTSTALDRYVNSRLLKGSNRPYPEQFCRFHRAAIQMLLRVSGGQWPPQVLPANQKERADLQVIEVFDTWMKDLRGLSANTRRHSRTEARLLLSWMREHDRTASTLSVADLDAYVTWRSTGRRRTGMGQLFRGANLFENANTIFFFDVSTIRGSPLRVETGAAAFRQVDFAFHSLPAHRSKYFRQRQP